MPIIDVMKTINDNASGFVVIVDKDFKLFGTATDGDIRRGLLKGISLQASISEVMNSSPLTLPDESSTYERLQLMEEKQISLIPIINDSGILISIESLNELRESHLKDNFVVIMAGGLGSRLGHLTKDRPKPLLPIQEKPILEVIVENIKKFGFKNIFISVNYKSHMIEDHFGDGKKLGLNIKYLKESKPLGTAGALKLVPKTNLPIVVVNGDVLSKINLPLFLKHHEEKKLDASMCVKHYEYRVPYGVVEISDDGEVQKLVEKPIFSHLINTGVYILNSRTIEQIPEGESIDMPSLLESLLEKKFKIGSFQIKDYWIDIGQIEDYERAQNEFEP